MTQEQRDFEKGIKLVEEIGEAGIPFSLNVPKTLEKMKQVFASAKGKDGGSVGGNPSMVKILTERINKLKS